MRHLTFLVGPMFFLFLGGVASAADTGPTPAASPTPNARRALLSKTTHASPSASPSPSQSVRLPKMTIVLTPTRIAEPLGQVGTTTSVVSSQTMQNQQLIYAADALREVPGVQIAQLGAPGTEAGVFIRGAPPDENLVLIDGVPVNASATSQFDLSRITTGDLDRIEVVRGAGGALYGSQAIGGVVNLISQEGSGPAKFSLLSEGGNRQTQHQMATFDGAEGRLAYSGSLSYFSSDGYPTTNNLRPINNNSDDLSGALRLDYHFDPNTTLRGFARYIRANVSLPTLEIGVGVPLDPTAHQRNEFMLFKGEIDHQFSEKLEGRFSAFYVRDDLRENSYPFEGFLFQDTSHIPDETRGANIDGIYTWNPMLRTLVGFDFLDRWVHSQDDFLSVNPGFPGRSLTIFNARRQEYAGYLEQEGRFFDNHLILTGGFRVDGNSTFGKEVSPSWAVAIPFDDYGVIVRGNYAEGFRAPTFNELFFPGFGNPKLGPELSSEYDGGITKTLGEQASITTTYFSRRVHNQIVAVPCLATPTSCPFGSLAGNAGRVDTQGIEFAPEWRPVKGLDLGGSFTWLDQRHDPPLFARIPVRVPKYAAAVVAQYMRTNLLRNDDRLTATTFYNFVGDRDDITPDGHTTNHAAYHRVDAAFGYSPGLRWGHVHNEEFLVRIQNLLDRDYQEALGFPSPPINVVAGLKLNFE
jgi:vitamin B12 transporter